MYDLIPDDKLSQNQVLLTFHLSQYLQSAERPLQEVSGGREARRVSNTLPQISRLTLVYQLSRVRINESYSPLLAALVPLLG